MIYTFFRFKHRDKGLEEACTGVFIQVKHFYYFFLLNKFLENFLIYSGPFILEFIDTLTIDGLISKLRHIFLTNQNHFELTNY